MFHSLQSQRPHRFIAVGLVLTLTLLALSFAAPATSVAAATPGAVPFEKVDVKDTTADIAEWVGAMHETQGLHRMDAGGKTWVLLAWGEKPTGGHSVDVTAVDRTETGVIVLGAKLHSPSESDIVTQVISYPYALISIDQTDEPLAAEFGQWPTPWMPADQEGTPFVSERVFLQLPVTDQVLGNTVRVKGAAKLFEGTFQVVLEDGHFQLLNEVATASAGGPEWGAFDLEFDIPEPSNENGLLIITWQDAKDGATIEEVAVPVVFENFRPIGDKPAFSDTSDHWAKDQIAIAVEAGFVNGYPDGTFKPQATVTRAEFLKMVIAAVDVPRDDLSGAPTFADTADHWSLEYVEQALKWGIIRTADYDSKFEPDRKITRLEMAVQLVRALDRADEIAEHAAAADAYSDVADLDAEARGYLGAAVEFGIFTGYPDGTIGPNQESTRAEAVVVIVRSLLALD